MKVAVIDNIDSFVYNLVQYVGDLGAEPVVFRNDASLREIEDENPERIIISPGPGRPENSGISLKIVEKFGSEIPILGVCLGHQVIGHLFGAEISYAREIMHGKTSMIEHDGSPIYRNISNPFEATRYHSLIVDPSSLPDCFRVTSNTVDGHEEIMGIEHRDYPLFGLQFHPESIMTSEGRQIVRNFLEVRAG
jgi:anthranilate synthase/aminodeoxychorismate synthase-like glutamine amidotransferase